MLHIVRIDPKALHYLFRRVQIWLVVNGLMHQRVNLANRSLSVVMYKGIVYFKVSEYSAEFTVSLSITRPCVL